METLQANPQPLVALGKASAIKQDRAAVLNQLRVRGIVPARLVFSPPACLVSMLAIDFLRECPGVGVGRLRQINAWAIRDQVNLATPLGELSPSRREWVAMAASAPARRVVVGAAVASRPQG